MATAMVLRDEMCIRDRNTAEEEEFAIGLIPGTVARLRELSPVYNKKAIHS